MTDPQMTVFTTVTDGHAVVTVAGEIDIFTASQLRDALSQVTTERINLVVVDLTRVAFIDLSGLNVLAGAQKAVGPDGALRVVADRPSTRKVFSISGLDTVMPPYISLADALADSRAAAG